MLPLLWHACLEFFHVHCLFFPGQLDVAIGAYEHQILSRFQGVSLAFLFECLQVVVVDESLSVEAMRQFKVESAHMAGIFICLET